MGAPDQVVENGEHVITAQGVKKAVMVAEQLYFYNDAGKVYGDTIQVSFFDDAGAFQSMLTAMEGEMNQRNDDMIGARQRRRSRKQLDDPHGGAPLRSDAESRER